MLEVCLKSESRNLRSLTSNAQFIIVNVVWWSAVKFRINDFSVGWGLFSDSGGGRVLIELGNFAFKSWSGLTTLS